MILSREDENVLENGKHDEVSTIYICGNINRELWLDTDTAFGGETPLYALYKLVPLTWQERSEAGVLRDLPDKEEVI